MFRLAWHAGKALWPEIKVLPLKASVALGASGLGAPRARASSGKPMGSCCRSGC
jgi:hypothetical protein